MSETISWEEILSLRELSRFPLVDDTLDERYNRIYPLMQREVQRVIEALKEFPVKVIIFGSALTMRCNIASDLDICIKTKEYDMALFHEVQSIIFRNVETACDVLYYNDLQAEDRVRNEIDEKGLVMKEAC